MVTWGQNQVFNIAGNNNGAPPTPAFGASQAPPPPSFGSSPAPGGGLFGAPAPGGGGLFGSAPAPAAGGGSFGNPAAGGLFGASPAPAPGGSLFGAPAGGGLFGASPAPSSFGAAPPPGGGLFGAPAGGLFGGQQQQQQQQAGPPAIPAQAALQAHMDASARQEAAKLQSALEELHHAYSGTSTRKASPLVTIVYNNMTSEQLQWQFAHQQSGGGYAIPPKPPQVSQQTWMEAVVNNPDQSTLIPTALIGAEALQARLGWQQQQASQYEQNVKTDLKGAQEELQKHTARVQQDMQRLDQMHATLRSRLLRIMNKVEVLRCMNLPLQTDEVNLANRLRAILDQLDTVTKAMNGLKAPAPPPANVDLPDKQRLQQVFNEHRQSIIYLSEMVQKENRDVQLLQQRVSR